MSSLYNLLNQVRQKPGMYIGAPSLTSLHMFLGGYEFSRQEQNIKLTAEEKEFEGFQAWIQERFKITASVSWAKIILLYSADERAGFELFFELWDEFIQQQNQAVHLESEKIVA